MKREIERRIANLEMAQPAGLSLSARAWLGHALTDDERATLEAIPVLPIDPEYRSRLSAEAVAWLDAG